VVLKKIGDRVGGHATPDRTLAGMVRLIFMSACLNAKGVVNGRLSSAKVYEGAVMKGCSQCGGKFGLIRHAFLGAQLCSKKCLEAYKRDWEWRRGWLRLLHVGGRIVSKSREHPTLV